MGNCIFTEAKPIRIMKPDGKILEYKSPTKVLQVLSDFPGHGVGDAVPVTHHLQQATTLLSGHLYFLVPTSADPEKPRKKKAVRFAEEPEKVGDEGDRDRRVVRIKVVVTKKELQEMVERGGMTAEEMICKMKSEEIISCLEHDDHNEDELQKWKPVLQSIPESEVALC